MGGCFTKPLMCNICLYNINRREKIKYMECCKHTFHHRCYLRWKQVNHNCPGCRMPLVSSTGSFYL